MTNYGIDVGGPMDWCETWDHLDLAISARGRYARGRIRYLRAVADPRVIWRPAWREEE